MAVPVMKESQLPAIFIAGIILVGLPYLFRIPASTIVRPDEIAILAAQVSEKDPLWTGNNAPFNLNVPEAGTVAFGSHEYYPYHLTTVRDAASGDVMVVITSEPSIPVVRPGSTSTHSFRTAVDNEKVYILMHDGSNASWPARLFSVISND